MTYRRPAVQLWLTAVLAALLVGLPACHAGSTPEIPVSLAFWGGTDEVAGSAYLLTVGDKHVLVDCGSFMSSSAEDAPIARGVHRQDHDPFPFEPRDVDALLITHAHADHTGRIHYLIAAGFDGPIFMTSVTADIYFARLEDDVHFSQIPQHQQQNVMDKIRAQVRRVAYGEGVSVTENVQCIFVDTGHLPGSASIVVQVNTGDGQDTITFSGDIGSGHHPFLNQPDLDTLSTTDTRVLVIESTYGHVPARDADTLGYTQLWSYLQQAKSAGNTVIIPAFGLDRTQLLLAAIGEGVRHGHLDSRTRVLVGGKSSCYFTRLYSRFQESRSVYDSYFSERFWTEQPMLGLDWTFTRSDARCWGRDPAPAINQPYYRSFDVIIAPSGTGDTALSRELLMTFAGQDDITIMKVSWAPPTSPMGQLGRGETVVRFYEGSEVTVRATIYDVGVSFSGHADLNMLLNYVGTFPHLEHVIIVHGDDYLGARVGLEASILERFPSLSVLRPSYGQTISPFDPECYEDDDEHSWCPGEDCLVAADAADAVGETVWVCGRVASTRRFESGLTLLNLGRAFPYQDFTVVIETARADRFERALGSMFHESIVGELICAFGEVHLYGDNEIPQIAPRIPSFLEGPALETPLPEPCRCDD